MSVTFASVTILVLKSTLMGDVMVDVMVMLGCFIHLLVLTGVDSLVHKTCGGFDN